MKKAVIFLLLFLAVGILVFVNYVYPFSQLLAHDNSLDLDSFRYFFVITTYVGVLFTIWIEREDLKSWNIDQGSLLTLIVFAVLRVNLHLPNELVFKNIVLCLGLLLIVTCVMNWNKIPQTSIYWTLIGLSSCLLVIPLAFVEINSPEKYSVSSTLYQTNFLGYFLHNLLNISSFVAPYEEIVMRGLLWGQARKWNIPDNKIVWIQGVLFWLLHFWQILTPITFFVALPMQIIILSLLVKYSKQLFPSIVSHTLVNLLLPIIISFWFKV